MKCPYCGSSLELEDEFCSFCGKPNQFAKKHQADMQHFNREFTKTQQSVYEKTHRFATLTTTLVILLVLVILNVAGAVFFSYSWRIGDHMVKKDILDHEEEHRKNLETFIQTEDYHGMSSYYNSNSLYIADEFQEYNAVVSVADNYFSIFQQLADSKNASYDMMDREELSSVVRSITYNLESIYNVEQNYNYRKDICLTEEKMAVIRKIQSQTVAILAAYGGLTLEEAKEIPNLSTSRQQEILERSLAK